MNHLSNTGKLFILGVGGMVNKPRLHVQFTQVDLWFVLVWAWTFGLTLSYSAPCGLSGTKLFGDLTSVLHNVYLI